MRFQTALVAAASVATSSAFLITPEIADAVNAAKNTVEKFIAGAPQSVDVQCHNCPPFVSVDETAASDENKFVSEKIDTTIHLEFTTRSGELQINNQTVFPLEAVNNKFPHLTAHQNRVDTGEVLPEVPIDFVLSSQKMEKPRGHPSRFGLVAEPDFELVTIDFTVIGLAGHPIKSQTAHADLILHDGVYSLARLRAAEFNPTSPEEDDLKACQNARNVQLCRIRLIANRKIREMMESAVSRAQGIKEWMNSHAAGNKLRPCGGKFAPTRIGTTITGDRTPHNRHGQHAGPHAHHHRHNRYVRFALFFCKALFVSILAGVAVGLVYTAIGFMIIAPVMLLRNIIKGAPRQPEIEVILEEGEKEGLMVEGDFEEPPAYIYADDAPTYQEIDAKTEN